MSTAHTYAQTLFVTFNDAVFNGFYFLAVVSFVYSSFNDTRRNLIINKNLYSLSQYEGGWGS